MSKTRHRFRTSELMTSLGLINRAVNSDPNAWSRLVYLYTPLIEYWAAKRGASDVENIRQEVLTSLFRALPSFAKRENGTFRGWIRTITNNTINRTYGNRELAVSTDSVNWIQEPAANAGSLVTMFDGEVESESVENGILFRRIMDWVRTNYSSKQANIFTRVIVEQRPPVEVADELSVTTNVIYQTKSRMLASIRHEFSDFV